MEREGVGKNSMLHSTGGRTPKYKNARENGPRACSCTGPTADQQFKLIKLETIKERRAQEDHHKKEAYECILKTRGWTMTRGDEHCLWVLLTFVACPSSSMGPSRRRHLTLRSRLQNPDRHAYGREKSGERQV